MTTRYTPTYNLELKTQNSKVIPSLFELDINVSQACYNLQFVREELLSSSIIPLTFTKLKHIPLSGLFREQTYSVWRQFSSSAAAWCSLLSVMLPFTGSSSFSKGFWEIDYFRFRKKQDERAPGISSTSKLRRKKSNLVSMRFNIFNWLLEVVSFILLLIGIVGENPMLNILHLLANSGGAPLVGIFRHFSCHAVTIFFCRCTTLALRRTGGSLAYTSSHGWEYLGGGLLQTTEKIQVRVRSLIVEKGKASL